jgi:uncharacterized membrane protein
MEKQIHRRRPQTQTLIFGAALTALVIILQLLGSFIHLGPFAISLVLIPIVIGAAVGGVKLSTWLGSIFGVVVLCTDAAAFFAVSIFGTVLTVMLKGIAAGLAAGFVYKLLEKKNQYLAVLLAALACPLANTGIFVLGAFAFFLPTIHAWGLAEGYANGIAYLFLGMIGANFLFEVESNILLSPIVVRLLNVFKKQMQ